MLFYPPTHSISPTAQILCPVLPNPTNGDVSISTRSSEGIATYTCNAGYALSGLQRRICASNGVWSGSQPTCKQPQYHKVLCIPYLS